MVVYPLPFTDISPAAHHKVLRPCARTFLSFAYACFFVTVTNINMMEK